MGPQNSFQFWAVSFHLHCNIKALDRQAPKYRCRRDWDCRVPQEADRCLIVLVVR